MENFTWIDYLHFQIAQINREVLKIILQHLELVARSFYVMG